MSTPVSAVLPAGAYVIRNRKTSTVLHIELADAKHQDTNLQAYQQDESQFADQQIWWLEPLADYNGADSGKGVVYSITSPGSGKSLDANPESGWVYANQNQGKSWQRWRLQKVADPHGEASYNIVNALTDKVLTIHGDKPSTGAGIQIQPHEPSSLYNRWEFAIPVAAFPPGWFQMLNVGTGTVLSHDYDHNRPLLLPAPESPHQSQHRSQWQFQWTLSHSKCFQPATAGERNSWYIINRLTRSPLSPILGKIDEKDFAGRDGNLAWKLELDPACNWKIINRTTSCLLQASYCAQSNDGTPVSCYQQTFTPTSGQQSWILRYTRPIFESHAPALIGEDAHSSPSLLDTDDETVGIQSAAVAFGKLTTQLPPKYTAGET